MKSRRQCDEERYAMETRLIYGKAFTPKWDYTHHVIPPISSSATFRLDSAQRGAQGFVEFAHESDDVAVESKAPIYIYDRLGEPNKDMLEEHLAFAECGGAAVTFSTGMAAISAVIGILAGTGHEIIAHRTLYGCTYSLLTNWYPRYKIGVRFLDLTEPRTLRKHLARSLRVVYVESPVNPTLRLIDIAALANIVQEENEHRKPTEKVSLVVDNTFATPFCQRPLQLGADFVVHSLTKNIGGFGTDMGGAVIGPEWSRDRLLLYRKDFGGVLATKSAWPILVYGLPTLSLRTRQQEKNAMGIARFLSMDSRIEQVNYPGLPGHPDHELAKRQMIDYDGNFAPGIMVYFTLKGSSPAERRDRGERLINCLARNAYTVTLAVSLGNIRTLVEHPASMTHSMIPPEEQEAEGIDPGGVRLSVGLEHPEDVLRDLGEALDSLQ